MDRASVARCTNRRAMVSRRHGAIEGHPDCNTRKIPTNDAPAADRLMRPGRSRTIEADRPPEESMPAADHIGNLALSPQATLSVQKAECDWPVPVGPRFDPSPPVHRLEGDHDAFGNGTDTIIATPGHTPGHRSLLVRLRRTGALLLSGRWHALRRDVLRGQPGSPASAGMQRRQGRERGPMQRMADPIARERARLWINHGGGQRDSLKMAPAFCD